MKTKLSRALSDRLFVALASLACTCLLLWGMALTPATAEVAAMPAGIFRSNFPASDGIYETAARLM